MILTPQILDTARLTYVPAENLLVAEDSDLPRPSRVFDDACDEGYTLRSHRTGRDVVYVVEHIERDREGDLVNWDLRPVSRADAHLPTFRIYND